MSQNVKYTEYTVISNTDIPNKKRVAVYKDFEKEIMPSSSKFENGFRLYKIDNYNLRYVGCQ